MAFLNDNQRARFGWRPTGSVGLGNGREVRRVFVVSLEAYPANMLMLGQRWPNVCSYVGSTSHANVGSTLFCSLGLRWPYRWRQPFANLQPMLIQRWPNVIQYGITLGQRTLIQRNLVLSLRWAIVGPTLIQRNSV